MADHDEDPATEPHRTDELATPRTRSAAAQAASRARRIGGASRPTSDAAAERDATETSQPAARTRVAGRRPSPGPRTETEADAAADSRVDTASSGSTDRRRWIPAGLAAAVVVGLAIVGVLLLQNWRDQPTRAEQREKLAASVNVAVTKILSYDYHHLDRDESDASARLTGKFRDQYLASMDSTIKKQAPPVQAVVVGEISSVAVTSVTGDGKQAVLLVLGQQTVTNTKQTTPRQEIVSLRVTAQLVRGMWLVSDLATV